MQAEEAERRIRVDAEMRKAAHSEQTRVVLANLLGVVTTTLASVAAGHSPRSGDGTFPISWGPP